MEHPGPRGHGHGSGWLVVAQVETLRRGDEIRLVSLPDVVIPVAELLPIR